SFLKKPNKTIDFSLNTRSYDYIGITLHTLARYQMENAALAVRAVEVLFQGERITAGQIQSGLAKAFWPGRMEEILPEVFVDGAHNEDGIRAFLDTVSEDGCAADGRRRILLFSVVQDKDYRSMIRQVLDSELFDRIFVAHMETGRAAALDSLRALWETEERGNAETVFCEDVHTALKSVLAQQGEARVYIAGSLYLVGEIKEFLWND
ncbi:MAG: hypothetical protein K2K10_00285, partial [Acetatifactor sp.]|nr:hypothetical protein [Acetatifactor sp.]